jgi:Flagellar hook-length control protein FliK
MINIPPTKPSTAIKSEIIGDVSRTWRIGQILNATTQQGGEAFSKVLIRLGDHTLEAKTPIKLENGQDIKLLVKAAGENNLTKLPLLSILPPSESPALEKSQAANIKLRQFIAIQASFSATQQTTQNLLANKQITNLLPKELVNLLVTLQSSLQVKPGQAQSSQLKQLIENSGVFLEAKLKIAPALKTDLNNALSNDFKHSLLQTRSLLANKILPETPFQTENIKFTPQLKEFIQQVLQSNSSNPNSLSSQLISNLPRPLLQQVVFLLNGSSSSFPVTPPAQTLAEMITYTLQQTTNPQKNINELSNLLHTKLLLLDFAQQVDRSLSQITSFQLQPLSREVDTLTLLLFSLVFKDKDHSSDIGFRIEQENKETDSETESWRVTLNFNLKSLGKIQSHIHLKDKQVSTIFHSEKESTSNVIREHLPILERNLQQAGFFVTGTLVKTKAIQESMIIHTQSHLLDENI